MEIQGKKKLLLYLEDWQIRMIKDVLDQECHVWEVAIEGQPVMRYFGMQARNADLDPKTKRMYFTEWQRREIEDETGEKCDFVELKPDVGHYRYMAPALAKDPKPAH